MTTPKAKATPKRTTSSVITSEQTPVVQALQNHLVFSSGKTSDTATRRDWYAATAHTVRDHVMERWVKTRDENRARDPKRVYYLSLEFLIGRMLSNAALNLGIDRKVTDGLTELGHNLENVVEMETDAAVRLPDGVFCLRCS